MTDFSEVRVFWISSKTDSDVVASVLESNNNKIRTGMYSLSGKLGPINFYTSIQIVSIFRSWQNSQDIICFGQQLSSHATDGSIV